MTACCLLTSVCCPLSAFSFLLELDEERGRTDDCLLPACPIEARTLFILFRNKLLGQLKLPSAMLRYLVKREFIYSPLLII
jgi:hypothetical protein